MGRKRQQPEGTVLFITAKGREHLAEKTTEWQKLTRAMGLILGATGIPDSEEA